MPRKKSNIHYIYKTTCIITGRYYIGMHSTSNLEDDYLGSGKRLRRSIRKYGKENHIKEILEFLPDRESLILRETIIVNSELINDILCMNIREGGKGGFSIEQQKINAINSNKKQKLLRETDLEWKNNFSKNVSYAVKKQFDEGKREKRCFCDWTGRHHSEESKRKIGIASSINNSGEKNPMYYKRWIYNTQLKECKLIHISELNIYIENGWLKGRKFYIKKSKL